MKNNKQLSYRNISCDSDQEIFFLYWAFTLLDAGYIETIERAESYLLSEAVFETYTVTTKLKTKTKIEEKKLNILREHWYTPEFKIVASVAGEKLFKSIINPEGLFFPKKPESWEIIIENKPKFDQNSMTRLFKINQKWVYAKYQEMVNLVIPELLFEQTFTPKEYLKTATGKQRKINFKVKTFEEWLNTIN